MTPLSRRALLALEDGLTFRGRSLGVPGETFGEMVFNTGMTGYQEVLTDPSYCGQIVAMTYPEIGIYGVNPEDAESQHVQVAGFVVHRAVRNPYNHRATQSLGAYLEKAGIVAIEGIDTRALTRRIRTHGAMRGAISALDLDPESLVARTRHSPDMLGRNLAQAVAPRETISLTRQHAGRVHVVVVDAGRKENICRDLVRRGAALTAVPFDVDVDSVLSLEPDGVLVSNGPGDPSVLDRTIALIRAVLKRRIPLAGICLGHQLLGLALGGHTYKMRFGHRGGNHPVKDMTTGRVLITTQNHGFAVDPTTLGVDWQPLELRGMGSCAPSSGTMAEAMPDGRLLGESPLGFGVVEITHLSLNDGTLEGLRLRDRPAFSVQFHPEACPGPHDAKSFFDAFLRMVNRG